MWDKAKVFDRQSKVFSFSKKALHKSETLLHLFVPWSSKEIDDLMFRLKAMVTQSGNAYIPLIHLNHESLTLTEDQYRNLKNQLERGVETHLYMSNMESIHVWKVKGVLKKEDAEKIPPELTVYEKPASSKAHYWVEVEDVFVLKASHTLAEDEIIHELESIINNIQTHQIFSPIQKLTIDDNDGLKRIEVKRWVELGRSVTYDYFIRSCELEDNIYQDLWKDLSRATQHCLIVADQVRHNGVLYRDVQKFHFLKESFENYLSAVMNELNEIYIRPFISVFNEYASMHEAWQEVQQNFVNPKIQTLINDLIDSDKDHVASIQDFLLYVKNAKSLLFSLKSKFAKKIAREEYLQLESFLSRQENLVESFLCKKLDVKLHGLLEIKDWFKNIVSNIDNLDKESLKNYTLKVTHLLTLMSSCNYTDNIFFKILEEKTSRAYVARTFEEEIKELMVKSKPSKKIA